MPDCCGYLANDYHGKLGNPGTLVLVLTRADDRVGRDTRAAARAA